jgi:hypothetical protein
MDIAKALESKNPSLVIGRDESACNIFQVQSKLVASGRENQEELLGSGLSSGSNHWARKPE